MHDNESQNVHPTFGEYLKAKRESLGKTIRGLAAELDMTPAYISDIEKGNRYAPDKHLEKMAEKLNLTGEDKDVFYDLAGISRNDVFPDLKQYISKHPVARVALRKARDLNISDSRWNEFIESMDENEINDGG